MRVGVHGRAHKEVAGRVGRQQVPLDGRPGELEHAQATRQADSHRWLLGPGEGGGEEREGGEGGEGEEGDTALRLAG